MANETKTSADGSDKWYSQPIFSQFWRHYDHCNQWLQQNGHKVIEFSDDLMADNCYKCRQMSANSYSNVSAGYKTCAADGRRRMDALEVIDENECAYDYDSRIDGNEGEDVIECDDSEEEVDISDEYLEFVMKTRRHQKERKKLNEKRLKYEKRVEFVDISRLESFSRKSIAPKGGYKSSSVSFGEGHSTGRSAVNSEHELRQQKMYELYGEDCRIIQGMEAALQLNFDRLCDLNEPKFWPIMPIRMASNPS